MNLTVFDSEFPGSSLRRFKAVIVLPYTPSFVSATIADSATRLTWDSNIADLEVRVLRESGPRVALLRSSTKAVGPISGRDFLDVTGIADLGNGCWVNAGSGIDVAAATELGYPVRPSFVRGFNSPGCGWYFEAVPATGADGSSTTHCRVHYVIHCDLKGWLPHAVVNNALTGSFVSFFTDLVRHIESQHTKK